jgi:hypothetical protein
VNNNLLLMMSKKMIMKMLKILKGFMVHKIIMVLKILIHKIYLSNSKLNLKIIYLIFLANFIFTLFQMQNMVTPVLNNLKEHKVSMQKEVEAL